MLAAGLLLVAAACTRDTVSVVEISTLEFASGVETLVVGETARFQVAIRDQDGNVVPPSVAEWSATPSTVVAVDQAGLVQAVGPGTGTIRVVARGKSASASMTVQPGPTFGLSRGSVEIVALVGSVADPAPEVVGVVNTGGGVLNGITAGVTYVDGATGWLTPSLESTVAPTSLRLAAAPSSLGPGEYRAVVRLSSGSSGVQPVEVPVRLSVISNEPVIGARPAVVAFSAVSGGAPPPSQTVTVANDGGGSLAGLAVAVDYEDVGGWLATELSASSAPATLTLRAATEGLARGTYSARVRITSESALNSPIEVSVLLEVGSTADLRVEKVGPDSVAAGARADYVLRVRNLGPSIAEEVFLVDTLPANGQLVAVPPGAQRSGRVLRWDLGDLAPGAERTFDVAVDVASGAVGFVFNRALLESPTLDPEPAGRLAETAARVYRSFDVAVGLSGPDSAFAGGEAVFRVDLRNEGPSDASGVAVVDTLPEGVEFVAATGDGELVGRAVRWPTLVTLSGGSARSYDVTVRLPLDARGTLSSTATVTSGGTDADPSNDVASIEVAIVARADLEAIARSEPMVVSGEETVLRAGALNRGPGAAMAVRVVHTLPEGVRFVSAGNGGEESGGVVTWPETAVLEPGDSVVHEIVVEVEAKAPATLVQRVEVGSGTPDPVPANDTVSSTTSVPLRADVELRKEAPDVAFAGAPVPYRLEIHNGGPDRALDVVVIDSLPEGAVVVAVSDGGAVADGVVVWPAIEEIAEGDTVERTLDVVFDPGYTGEVRNVARLRVDALDPDTADHRAEASTLIDAEADLAIDKSGPPDAVGGDTIAWTIAVVNQGPSRARLVRVTDTLPTGVTLLDAGDDAEVAEGVVSWPVADSLDPGAELKFEIVGVVDPDILDDVTNVAAVTAATPDPNLGDNRAASVVDVPPPADLTLTKSASSTAVSGSILYYRLRVENEGPARAEAVILADTLPEGVTLVSASGGAVVSGPVVSWNLGGLGRGRGRTRELWVRIDDDFVGELVNRAGVSSPNPDPTPDDARASASTQVVPPLISASDPGGVTPPAEVRPPTPGP